MTGDPLLSDDVAMLLRALPSEALEGVVGICRRHTSWSPFSAERAREAHALGPGADFTLHADAIARELIWWGSHDFSRQVGIVPTWRDIVSEVARRAGVEKSAQEASLPVWEIEQAILKKALIDWEKLSPEQRDDILRGGFQNS